MEKTKTKKALFMSVLSMVLCIAMLIGMTFAWFTDTASTGVNKIQAGNLKIGLYYANNTTGEGAEWNKITENSQKLNFLQKQADNSVKQEANILWEPGCTYSLPALKVANEGNLALKYKVILKADTITDKAGKTLLDVFEWKVNDKATDLKTLKDGIAVISDKALMKDSSDIITISAHMKEEAGNDYQGLTIQDFKIDVVATQYTYENDSYGDQYDKNAQYPDVSYANASDQDSLKDAIEGSKTKEPSYIEVSGNNLTIDSSAEIGADTIIAGKGTDNTTLNSNNTKISEDNITIKDMTIKGSGSTGTGGTLNVNGNNTTIENVDYKGDGNIAVTVSTGAKNEGTVFRNTKVTNAFRGIQFWSLSGDSLIDNCVLDVAGYTFNIDAAVAGSTLTIKDSTLNGWTSYTNGIKLVSFENCKLGLNAYQYLRPYSETKITDCEFTSAGYQLNAGGSDAYTITITNCTKNETKITAENVKTLLLDTDDWNSNATLIVDGTTVTLN